MNCGYNFCQKPKVILSQAIKATNLILGVVVIHRLQQTHEVRVRILVGRRVGSGPFRRLAGRLLAT